MEINENVKVKIENTILLYSFKTKRGGRKQSLFVVDLSKPCLINGTNEEGFELKHFPEMKKSNSCITFTNLLRVLHGDIVNLGFWSVQNCKL